MNNPQKSTISGLIANLLKIWVPLLGIACGISIYLNRQKEKSLEKMHEGEYGVTYRQAYDEGMERTKSHIETLAQKRIDKKSKSR